jgi:hypothetical protein
MQAAETSASRAEVMLTEEGGADDVSLTVINVTTDLNMSRLKFDEKIK